MDYRDGTTAILCSKDEFGKVFVPAYQKKFLSDEISKGIRLLGYY